MDNSLLCINLILILVLNVLFFCSGICLNSLVIISFWRSVQLRKKLCYFMIMVLSCCDLLMVAINNPVIVTVAMMELTGNLSGHAILSCIRDFERSLNTLLSLPFLSLVVMNLDRYLATHHPIFHRTSVTKKKLLTLLVILIFITATLDLISFKNFVISYQISLLIFLLLVFPPIVFLNYKLFAIARRSRRNKLPEMKSFSVKSVSSCLLAVACLLVLSIPSCAYIGLTLNSDMQTSFVLDNVCLAGLWAKSTASMNATFNCLIFYWKNKILRTEGMKIFSSIKRSQLVES